MFSLTSRVARRACKAELFGKIGIFIHPGSAPAHSDGCIVCAGDKVELMYNTINPKDGRNVEVRVTNPG